jgi:hypothetical protein
MPLPLLTVLRTNPGAWLAAPLIIICVLLTAGYVPSTSDPYSMAQTSAGLIALVFAAPVSAAAAAWEGGRLRRADLWAGPIVRRRPAIVFAGILPAVVAGSVAVIAAAELHVLAGGLLLPDGRLIALAVLVVTAHSAAGFAAGLVLPTAVALPAALIASFAWMALPAAVEPLWLRHLNGALATCCQLSEDLSAAAAVGAALVAGGIITAALVITAAARPQAAHWFAAGAVLVVVATCGAGLVSSLGPDPSTKRDVSLLTCADRIPDVRVCVWPEHQGRLAEIADLAAAAVAAWRSAGVPVSPTFSEASVPSGRSGFGFTVASSHADILTSMAYAQLPAWPDCAESEPYFAVGVLDDLEAWYSLLGGLDEKEINHRFATPDAPGDQPADQVARALQKLPADVAADWTRQNLAAAAGCAEAPTSVPLP